MIPQDYITAWSNAVPWVSRRQVEQDLIISRALIAIFSDPFLRSELRFRGGTALNKIHFPAPLRYSEDIDLVRTTAGPISPILDRVRDVLDPWLGKPKFDQSPVAPKLKYAVEAEDKTTPGPIKLKIEINTRERDAYDPPIEIAFAVENPWFTGEAGLPTFSREEMLATKLRALLQRNKPELKAYADADREIEGVAGWIEKAVADGIAHCEIGILMRSNDQLARARAAVKAAGHTQLCSHDLCASSMQAIFVRQ